MRARLPKASLSSWRRGPLSAVAIAVASVACAASPATRGADGAVTVAAGPAPARAEGAAIVGAGGRSAGEDADPVDPTPLPSLPEARAELATLLGGTKVKATYQWDEARVAQGRGLGFDEARALRLLATLVESGDEAGEIVEAVGGKEPLPAVDLLLVYVSAVGSARSIPRVAVLAARAKRSSSVVDELLERAAAQKAETPCAVPSADEITKQRAGLVGFAIVERTGGSLTAREPTASELDDLAYLHAALARDGGPVGKGEVVRGVSVFQKPPTNLPLDAAREALELASKDGEPKLVQSAARNYLSLLGYPGVIRADEESRMTWGGPGYANVMRELARVDEVLGDTAEAAVLYRRAPPGGGACGTSVSYRLETQRKGVIRAAERAGQCATVVRERLFAPHDDGFDYGPTRLAASGWDVPRMYRAALLTVERSAPAGEITRTFDQLPSARRDEAVARFERLGAEPWAHDLRAVAGLADAEGERALPTLLPLLGGAADDARVEVLAALADLADLPDRDPCVADDSFSIPGRSFGGETPRMVKPLNHVCATKLSSAGQKAIVDAFVAAAKDKSDRVREAAAAGIARVALPARAEPILTALARDGYARPGWSRLGKNKRYGPLRPVAEAAKTALEHVKEAKQRDRERQREARAARRATASN